MDSLNLKLEQFFDKYKVNNRNPNSEEYFSTALKISINEYDLSIQEFAVKFEVMGAVVERWAEGTQVPHPLLRREVLKYIDQKID